MDKKKKKRYERRGRRTLGFGFVRRLVFALRTGVSPIMPRLCAVVGCAKGRLKTCGRSGDVSLHKLPTDAAMRSIWLRAVVLRRAVDSGVRICSLHFRPEDFEQHLHVSRSLGKSGAGSRSEAATEELVVGLGRPRKAPIQSSASLAASPVQSA